MKKISFLVLLMATASAFSQVGIGTTSPTSNSILDLRSTTKGLLVPRLTTAERTTLGTSLTASADVLEKGMEVYDTDLKAKFSWDGTAWINASKTPISSLTAATATNTIDNLNFAQTWNWSSATTQTPLTLLANNLTTAPLLAIANLSTAATNNIVNISSSSTAATALNVSATMSGMNTTKGYFRVSNNAAPSFPNGLFARIQPNNTLESGLTVLNNGKVGIGIELPTEALDVVGNVKFSGALLPNNAAGTAGQVLTSAGPGLVPTWTTPAGGTPALANTNIFVGNASNVATAVAMSGDATIANTGALTIANNAVTSAKIADGTVASADILDATIATADIADSAVTSAKIADGTIASADILDATIATADIANNAVTSAKIVDATIVTADIADNAVTSAKIVDATIVTADIADNAVTSAKIVDGTIATADIANNAVTVAKLPAGATATSFLRGDGTWTNMGITKYTITGGTATLNLPLTTFRSYKIKVSGFRNNFVTVADEYVVTMFNNSLPGRTSVQQVSGVYSHGAQTMQKFENQNATFILTPTHGLYTLTFPAIGGAGVNAVVTTPSNMWLYVDVIDLWY